MTAVYFNREVWNQIADALNNNPEIPRTHALGVMVTMYGAAQAVAVRRIAHGQTGDIAFDVLLSEIEAHAVELTKVWWLSHYQDPWGKVLGGYRDWGQNFAGTTDVHLDPALVRNDLTELKTRVDPIIKYVNKWVAHRAVKPPSRTPTFGDLNRAIDFLGRLFQRYTLLLEVADRHIIPPLAPGDLMAPFRVPWLPPLPKSPVAARS